MTLLVEYVISHFWTWIVAGFVLMSLGNLFFYLHVLRKLRWVFQELGVIQTRRARFHKRMDAVLQQSLTRS